MFPLKGSISHMFLFKANDSAKTQTATCEVPEELKRQFKEFKMKHKAKAAFISNESVFFLSSKQILDIQPFVEENFLH
jgi:hypothetical protein